MGRLTFLLMLWLAFPALADLAGDLEGLRQRGNLAGVAQQVFAHQDESEQLFRQRLGPLMANPQDRELRELVNVLARALLLAGRTTPTQVLKDAGLLHPSQHWDGTAFEDDPGMKTRRAVPTALAPEPQVGDRENRRAALELAIRVGNLEGATRLLEQLRAQGDPQIQVMEVVALQAAGFDQEALRVPVQSSDPYLHLARAEAGLDSARPSVVEAELGRLEPLLERGTGTAAVAGRFIIASLRLAQRLERGERPTFAGFLEQHQRAYAYLQGLDPRQLPTGYGRWICRAAGIWVREALRLEAAEVDDFPVRAQLDYLVRADLRILEKLNQKSFEESFGLQPAQPSQFLQLWNPEFYLGLFELKLSVLGQVGPGERFEELLATMLAPSVQLEERFKEANLAYQTSTLGVVKDLNGDPMIFSWFAGDVPRLLGRYSLQRARRWLDRAQLSRADHYDFRQDLTQAQKYLKDTGSRLGVEDWRFVELAYQLSQRPEGWQATCQPLVAGLRTDSQRAGDRSTQILALTCAGELAQAQGQSAAAIVALQEAVALVETYVREAGAEAAGAAGLRQRYRRAYELLADLWLQSQRDREAFELLGRLAQLQALPDAPSSPVLRKLQELQRQTRSVEGELADKQQNGRPAELQKEVLASTRSEFYTALGDLRRQHPEFEQRLAVRPVNFSQLQANVPANTLVVQLFPSEKSLYLFLMTDRQLKIVRQAVSRTQLDKLVRRYRGTLLAHGDVQADSAELYRWLVQPLESDLRDKEVVAFIPTGSLFYLPLQALGRSGEHLIERKQVVVLTRSSDLEHLSRPVVRLTPHLLALGNPDGSLPAAAQEAQAIAQLFPDTRLYLGEAARKELLQGDLGPVNALHLATHGVLNPRSPQDTFLVMAQGRLSVAEIAGLDLKGVRLVTLSACDSGLEGGASSEMQSLADSFGFAGASTLVASLWKVSDQATSQLMQAFYEGLRNGDSPARALQQAQIQLLRQSATSSPLYWAPFELIGDWR